jgi:hypothetical protein
VAETTVKGLLCCGFRRTDKAMGQVYQCWWRVCREIKVFFQVRISHISHFISICAGLYTDSPLYLTRVVRHHIEVNSYQNSHCLGGITREEQGSA